MSNPDASPVHLDAEALYQTLLAQTRAGLQGAVDAAIVGIHTGGAWVAERLARDLGMQERLGFIDISFYRDDYAKKGLQPRVKATQIAFDVDHATIVLVDDVLFTGRTVRAAVNVLFDYGRPARIKLAALADRGGRELPVAAEFVGATVALSPSQSLKLSRDDSGQFSLTIQS